MKSIILGTYNEKGLEGLTKLSRVGEFTMHVVSPLALVTQAQASLTTDMALKKRLCLAL